VKKAGASCALAAAFVAVSAARRRVAAPPRVPACRRRVPSPLPRTVAVATAPHAHSTMEAPQEAEVDFSEVFSVDKIAYNAKALNYCRVFVAIISGCAAGILGQTGLLGFLTFFITTFLLSLTLYMKVKGDPKPYFKDAQAIWTEGVVQSLMSYVLFWTLFYDIIYIY
jgi:hypothetical protein